VSVTGGRQGWLTLCVVSCVMCVWPMRQFRRIHDFARAYGWVGTHTRPQTEGGREGVLLAALPHCPPLTCVCVHWCVHALCRRLCVRVCVPVCVCHPYRSLCWNLSKVIPRKDLPRIYTMSLPVAYQNRKRDSVPLAEAKSSAADKWEESSLGQVSGGQAGGCGCGYVDTPHGAYCAVPPPPSGRLWCGISCKLCF
jgi:hypothetical protein